MVITGNIIKNSFILILLSIVLIACTSDEETWRLQLEKSAVESRTAVDNLGKHLNAGTITKASLLTQYAAIVKTQNPELSTLVDTLALDATIEGPGYKSLVTRLNEANAFLPKAPTQGLTVVQSLVDEYHAIKTASRTDIYAMMLTDPINVLADMSNGKLGRVESMSKEASMIANGAQD